MARLLLATANPGKLTEFQNIFRQLGIETLSPGDLGINDQPDESGETFAGNSLLKANWYWQLTQLPVLADDGGLEIDAFGGEPGVHSRRIGGLERTDAELNQIILGRIASVPEDQRTARLKTVLTLRVSADMNFQAEGSMEGLIRPSDIAPDPGYPYRAIFWVPSADKFYQDFTEQEILSSGHRAKAIQRLLPEIQHYLL